MTPPPDVFTDDCQLATFLKSIGFGLRVRTFDGTGSLYIFWEVYRGNQSMAATAYSTEPDFVAAIRSARKLIADMAFMHASGGP